MDDFNCKKGFYDIDNDTAVIKRVKTSLISSLINETLKKEYWYWIYFILSLMLKCVYFQFATKINSINPFFSQENILMFFSVLFTLLILISSILLIFNKNRLTALFVLNISLSVLIMSDTNFFRYYYSLLTIPVIFQADIKLLNSVDQSIMSLFKIKDLIYLFDLPFVFIWFKNLKRKGIEKINFSLRAISFILIFIISFIGFFAVYKETKINTLVYNGNYIARKFGVLYSHFDNAKIYISENLSSDKNPTQKDVNYVKKYFSKKNEATSSRKFKGIAKGKNLIVVQAEALQGFMVGTKISGEEITPNLNSLIKESLYFNNLYYQVASGNTSDAEFVFNTSLFPASEGAAYIRYPQNTYYSLAKMLKGQGYKTYALHAFTAQFWNREEMYKSLGFDKFINSNYYEMDDFAGWESNALSDMSFFRQSFDKIDTSAPFYSFFVTLSSHHPFEYFEDYEFNVGELQGTLLGNFIKAINYEDKCLGEFINQLKKRGLFDNSLLVIYGDHSGIPKFEADQLMDFLGIDFSEAEWIKLQKVPCIMHYPGLKNGEVMNITAGDIDLLPTIANLMDFEAPYALGNDLLNSEYGYVILRNGSVITDNYIFLNELCEIYDSKSGKTLNIKNYEKELKTILKKLYISDMIIEKDIFSKF